MNTLFSSLAFKAKALALNVSETELKVLEATNEDAWGPHGKDMQEIARLAEDPEQYSLIMGVISQRLQERNENWRLCYKALLLLDFLCKQGPIRVVDDLQRSQSTLKRLRDDYEYKDAKGQDQGINVRNRAGELLRLVFDSNRLLQEREKASKNAGKYKGVSSDDMRRMGSSGFSSDSPKASPSMSRHTSNPSFHASSFGAMPGAGGAAGSSRASGFGKPTDDDDPFEATRKRIEKLKQGNDVKDPDPATMAVPAKGSSLNFGAPIEPPAPEKKGPKRLSEVKVNPQISNLFAGMVVAPQAPVLMPLAGPPKPANPLSKTVAPAAAPAPAASSGIDLLGDLDAPAPAAPAPAPAAPAPPKPAAASFDLLGSPARPVGSSGGSGFDPFAASVSIAAAPTQPPAPQPVEAPSPHFDPFGSFTAAPAAPAAPTTHAPPPQPSSSFDPFAASSLAPAAAPASASQGGAAPATRPPLPLEDFADGLFGAPVSAPLVPAAAAAAPLTAFPVPTPAAAASSSSSSGFDPFGDFQTTSAPAFVSAGPSHAPHAAPKGPTGPVDPFDPSGGFSASQKLAASGAVPGQQAQQAQAQSLAKDPFADLKLF